jgi:2-hydroxy-4-carboxymuconate semialdehyde hemiacetal dehydrogenase
MAHLVDFGVWMLAAKVRRIHGFMPPVDPATGIPMDAWLALETDEDQSLVCAGSYYGRERIFEVLVVTDRDSYRLDVVGRRLTTGSGSATVASEEETCALVAADFLSAVAEGHEPCVPGADALRTMAVLQEVQDAWDRRHGRTALPGRPVR